MTEKEALNLLILKAHEKRAGKKLELLSKTVRGVGKGVDASAEGIAKLYEKGMKTKARKLLIPGTLAVGAGAIPGGKKLKKEYDKRRQGYYYTY